jgi:predicted nucleic acid-binding protein
MNVKKLSGRLLIDTNVLIYATLAADARHVQAQKVLSLRTQSGIEMFVSVQNLAEMYPNLTGPKNQPPDSPSLAREKILSLTRLRGITVLPLISANLRASEYEAFVSDLVQLGPAGWLATA